MFHSHTSQKDLDLMSNMNHLNNYLNKWGDHTSREKIKNSERGSEVHEAEITNHLVDLAQRFERSPMRSKLEYWSKDLVQSGIKEHQVREVCQRIGRSFERFPTLAQIFELLRSHGYVRPDVDLVDPQTKKDQDEARRIKQIWSEKVGIEILPKMCTSYCKNVLGITPAHLERFGMSGTLFEMLVLLDWKRSGFGKPDAIIKQGLMSQSRVLKQQGVKNEEEGSLEH
jgi:hypothetical protein